ncbi:VOC family protein [Nocardia sp. NPDC058176]|uniref:VOC family protein n=1 Tax=Nocardia sp. NPDC058176 TaxID=3346368 RepID=UPI0036DCA66F
MTTLDHLVLAAPDLPGTVDRIARALGVAPIAGGRHNGVGTRNYLLGLDDHSYLEIIGIDRDAPEPEHPRPFGLDTLTEPRLAAWLAQVSGIETVVRAARAAGFDPGEPRDMSRTTVEGEVLSWQLTAPFATTGIVVVPYLIDWLDSAHPARSLPRVSLRSFEAVHPDPAPVEAALDALGTKLTVAPGVAPALIAVLDGPAGSITLV